MRHRIEMATLLSALLISNISLATTCYEKSPNLISLGDRYYDLDVTPPTAEDRKAIISTAKKMVGSWKGKGSIFQCRGPDEDPVVENREIRLTAEVSITPSGELHIDTKKYIKEENMWLYDNLVLFSNLADQSVSLTPNGFEVVEKFRLKANGKYRPLTEIRHTATYSQSTLSYTISRYINGYLAVEERWKLTRSR